MRNLVAVFKLLLFVMLTLVLFPVHVLFLKINGSMAAAKIWHHIVAYVFNLRVCEQGRAYTKGPVVYLSNHISYLDIVVLGARLPAVFVAKSEVASWPVFGVLAKLQKTVFIERKVGKLAQSKSAIKAALDAGLNIIFFGEGTSTDGRGVKPFKPALLEMFFEKGATDIRIQPVAIVLKYVDGVAPVAQDVRDLYAWWRPETTLVPHLWAFAKSRGASLTVHYLPVLSAQSFESRKTLAVTAHQAVDSAVQGRVSTTL